MRWNPIQSAPDTGPKVLAAHRHTKGVSFVWPSELSQKASDGSTFFAFWCEVTHPSEDGCAQPGIAALTDNMGIPLSCGKPLCSPFWHHNLCSLPSGSK
jgi:hypothetical protein